MNARIQVEHPVTEIVTSVDLIHEQIHVAAGEPVPARQEDVVLTGTAIECYINAEDPTWSFAPTPGIIDTFDSPNGPWARVDTGYTSGSQVSPYYDSLLAKLVAWSPFQPDRQLAGYDLGYVSPLRGRTHHLLVGGDGDRS